ncbi:MAG: chloride channel protein [Desulfomicrobium sp.]|nr:chloride channel protein [Pseudomonadota bacterium]MBV1712706.1 chloride channel protein [Desulfomicrobium sp.]MBU4571675.1 chloride channel protein [Pseudomonadota bacterium]MBU4595824.1 chloride channel protein [Pseudomonadota bacterium]MBV1721130.1 chloride channel protein [Desulfomicrobium sp.]
MRAFFRAVFKIPMELSHSYHSILNFKWLALGAVVGAMTGTLATIFYIVIEWLQHLLLTTWAGYTLPVPAGENLFSGPAGPSRPWLLFIFLGAVGILTGYLLRRFVPQTRFGGTDGTDTMIKAFHHQEGHIPPSVPAMKVSTSILTIAAGGSAGREGPISLLGAGCGSWLAGKLRLTAKERRILLLAGAAGGLGAIFRAPLGGALTAVEVIYREDFEAEALLPSIISSVVSYSLFTLVFGAEPIFGIPKFEFSDMRELPVYALLGLVCAATGWFYVHTFRFIKFKVFWPLTDRFGFVPAVALGGLGMAAIGYQFPQLLGGGQGWLELAMLGKLSVTMMAGMIIGKTVATSVTLGSGMSGGMFAPALFVGGMSGGVIGSLGHRFFPSVVTEPGGYVLVGMAAFFAGVASAPIGPLVMVCELTQGYGLLAPLMLATAIALVLGRHASLYENQVDNKFESPAHVGDATINILEREKVEGHFKPGRVSIVEEGTHFGALTDIIVNSSELCFPVRGAQDKITGILAVEDLRKVLYEDTLCELLVAGDVARKAVLLRPDEDLYSALLKFVESDLAQLPVVDSQDPTAVLGMLAREDVFTAYAKTLKSMKEQA